MKLSEIITSVQRLLQDDQFSEDSITESANWVVEDLFSNVNTRLMQSSDVMEASAGDTDTPFPDDLATVITMYAVSATQPFDLEPRYLEYPQFVARFPNYASLMAAPLGNYTHFGNGLRFSAPLNADLEIAVDYYRNPVKMKAPGDTCEVPDKYDQLVKRLTLAYCMEQNEDYAEAANERNNVAPLVTTFNRRESVGMDRTGPVIMRTNRRRSDWDGYGTTRSS